MISRIIKVEVSEAEASSETQGQLVGQNEVNRKKIVAAKAFWVSEDEG